jgi:hypothetical protein
LTFRLVAQCLNQLRHRVLMPVLCKIRNKTTADQPSNNQTLNRSTFNYLTNENTQLNNAASHSNYLLGQSTSSVIKLDMYIVLSTGYWYRKATDCFVSRSICCVTGRRRNKLMLQLEDDWREDYPQSVPHAPQRVISV